MEENNDLRELLQHTENELVNLLNKEHQDVTTDSGVGGCETFYISSEFLAFKVTLYFSRQYMHPSQINNLVSHLL